MKRKQKTRLDLMTQYSDTVIDAMHAIVKDERENILKAADVLSDETVKGKIIHIYGAGGHSSIAAMEIFWRAGGLANVNGMFPVGTNVMTAGPTTAKVEGFAHYIFNFYDVNPGDVLILVNFYGLNITAVDMALEAKKRTGHGDCPRKLGRGGKVGGVLAAPLASKSGGRIPRSQMHRRAKLAGNIRQRRTRRGRKPVRVPALVLERNCSPMSGRGCPDHIAEGVVCCLAWGHARNVSDATPRRDAEGAVSLLGRRGRRLYDWGSGTGRFVLARSLQPSAA